MSGGLHIGVPAFLFDVKPVVAYNLRHTYGVTIEELNGDVFFRGENPPYGAVITYYLRDAAPGNLELTISNGGGEILRTLAGPGDAGLHQVVWDLDPDADRGRADPPQPLQRPSNRPTCRSARADGGGTPAAPARRARRLYRDARSRRRILVAADRGSSRA